MAPAALEIGMQPIPGYRLRHQLGVGGFGAVWEADNPHGQPVALKFLPCDGKTAAAREIRSIQAIRGLAHPNLVHVEQVWCHERYLIVAMELADGSLQDLFDTYLMEYRKPIPAEQVCHYLAQAAAALDFLNARQHRVNGQVVSIQHCDVKPSNILISGDRALLADFGLSSCLVARMQVHQRAGSLEYAAPEIFQGRLSEQSDQYALAVTYCLLRGGELPFSDTPLNFRTEYARPAPGLAMLTEPERPVVARALHTTPQNRWPGCTALMQHLLAAVAPRDARASSGEASTVLLP